ncbi:MAG TPA: DUF2807 domain-containing protein [Puia sp.]|jgi:hypothetical protein|nr:DUF2807 domain-containing protein [Puia sp.]
MKANGFIGWAMAGMLAVAGTASAQSAQVRSVSGYSSIANSGSFAVHVKINGTESLKIEGADAATIGEIETVVAGGNLEIRWKRGWHGDHHVGKIDINVTAKSLTALTSSGSGSLDVDGVVQGKTVYVTLSGSGTVTLKGKSAEADITISGSGKLSANGLVTDAAEAMISGSGNTYITVNKTISGSIVGSGNVVYSGNATINSVSTVGSGRVRKAN